MSIFEVIVFQIMATDGLWDVLENEVVAKITFDTLQKYPNEKHRYTMIAQELVAKSRGRSNESGKSFRINICYTIDI